MPAHHAAPLAQAHLDQAAPARPADALARLWRIGRAVQAGTVWINTYKQFSVSTPFGGWRDSGLGREKGREGIFQYMEQKSLYWGLNEQPLGWAN